MHEQKHSEVNSREQTLPGDQQNSRPLKRSERIRQLAEPMQEFALKNSLMTHSAHKAAILRGDFSQLIQIQKTVLLHVILTISPADNEADEPFWHCSMSLVSSASGKAKTIELWTNREKANVRDLLPEFLGKRGLVFTQGFSRTRTALHCYRDLRAEELVTLEGNINGHI